MYITTSMVKGRKYYQVRECFRDNGKVRERVIIHLGTHPTIEAAFREAEERYFAGRKGREYRPLTDADREAWDRVDQLYNVRCKHDGEHPGVSARIRAEYMRQAAERVHHRPKPIPPWCQTILGLSERATPDEIRAARDRKARECHPDQGGSDAAMAAINEAYERLTG
jgi:hypothetical protein